MYKFEMKKKSLIIKIMISALVIILVVLIAYATNTESISKTGKIPYKDPTTESLDIDQAVSQAIKSQGKSYHAGETATEGHIILDTEEKDGVVKAYTISSFGSAVDKEETNRD